MYGGAALSAVEILIGFTTIGSLRSAIKKQYPNYTATQIHGAEVAVLGAAVVVGLLAVGLWILMARANGAGRSWARIVASVLFGLNSLDLVSGLVRPHASVALALGILVWLIGLGAIVSLWQRESSAYFQAMSAGPR